MNDSILDCCRISTPQQVHLIFDSRQYNLGPDRREVIGIIVHVPPCHCVQLFYHIIIVQLQELYLLLSFSQTKHFANLTSDFAPCPMAFCNAASQKGTKLKCWWGIIG
jgi:hypothetical protein